jgi:endonuclease-3 related protein
LQSPTTQWLNEMFDLLLDQFSPQDWWPGETPFEVMVGAVLTQNTNWKNVEKAIDNLKRQGLLNLENLHALPLSRLAEEIRPAGYYNIKAKRLRNLTAFIEERYGGDLAAMLDAESGTLREGLLSIKGVGPETADSILLYAANLPVFVIDAYTYRILRRHGMIDEETTYDELQSLFMDHLPEDSRLFNEFHALIVRTAKDYCRKTPRCEHCPLRSWGPSEGPISFP